MTERGSGSGEIQSAKDALRADLIARRKRIVPRLREHLSARIGERVTASDEFRSARSVLLYASLPHEVRTDALLDQVIASGRTLALPRAEGEHLRAYVVRDPEADLREGRFGVREPIPERCAPVGVDDLDLLLVPGVGFDYRGARLGQGRGFYDRFLAPKQSDAAVYGLGYSFQLLPHLPAGERDVRLDGVITEEDFLAPGTVTRELDSPEAMRALGERLAQHLEAPVLLALTGPLGAGKTTLTQGLLRGFGAGESAVSPTYLLVNEYDAQVPVRHLDAYRLDEGKLTLEDREILNDSLRHEGVTIIEWAERAPSLIPATRVAVAIETIGPEQRRVEIRTVRRRDRLEGSALLA